MGLEFEIILQLRGCKSWQMSQPAKFANNEGARLHVKKQPDLSKFWQRVPAPKFEFGEYVKHEMSRKVGEIIGMQWRHTEIWFYCVDYTSLGYGQWFREDCLTKL